MIDGSNDLDALAARLNAMYAAKHGDPPTLCKCLVCGHEWQSRVAHPKKCANCKSPYWELPELATRKLRTKKRTNG